MTVQEKINLIEKLVAEVIEELGCGDEECDSCPIGVSLGEDGKGIPCLNRAFDAGYKLHSDECDESIGVE